MMLIRSFIHSFIHLPTTDTQIGDLKFLTESRKCVIPVVCVKLGKLYVVKHNLITDVYLITVMERTTCFGLYWPSSGCLRGTYDLTISMHAHVLLVRS